MRLPLQYHFICSIQAGTKQGREIGSKGNQANASFASMVLLINSNAATFYTNIVIA
jgi:hypothetical protein